MTKYSPDSRDMAVATELSLGFGMVVAIGVLLGTLAFRHVDTIASIARSVA